MRRLNFSTDFPRGRRGGAETSLGRKQGVDLARQEFEHAQRFVRGREVADADVRRLVAQVA